MKSFSIILVGWEYQFQKCKGGIIVQESISKVDERIPFKRLLPLGLQHMLSMYAGAIAVPLIVGGALKLDPKSMAMLVEADLFTCGIATIIQSFGIGSFFGIRLPVMLGVTFTAVGPMIAIGAKYGGKQGMAVIYGSIICSGIFMILLSLLVGKLMKFFPTVVSGSVVTIIGLSLIPVGINDARDAFGAHPNSVQNILLATIVMLTIILCNKFFKGFMQAISVLFGLIAGYVVALLLGMVNFSEMHNSAWVGIVHPFYFGVPVFNLTAILTMCIVALITMVESTGVFIALGDVVERPTQPKDVQRGIAAEGLACILGGIFNAFPYTTFSQNVGLVALTKIRSRFVTITAGCILILLGLLPKFAAIAVTIPGPVIGGAMILMFSMVFVSGLKMLSTVDFNENKNMLIVACAVGIGLGVTVAPDMFSKMPKLFNDIFGSGIVSGTVVAVLLNLLFNFEKLKENTKVCIHDENHGI